jgi:hypothetical protein
MREGALDPLGAFLGRGAGQQRGQQGCGGDGIRAGYGVGAGALHANEVTVLVKADGADGSRCLVGADGYTGRAGAQGNEGDERRQRQCQRRPDA